MASSSAAGAYAATQRLSAPSGGTGTPQKGRRASPTRSARCWNVGRDRASNADQQTGRRDEGKADMVDVVTAVAESESALETLVAVRDKVIAAYEEIMRMSV